MGKALEANVKRFPLTPKGGLLRKNKIVQTGRQSLLIYQINICYAINGKTDFVVAFFFIRKPCLHSIIPFLVNE